MKKISLKFGLISGGIVSAFMGTTMAIMSCGSSDPDGGMTSMIIGFGGMILAFSLIFVAIKNLRDKENGGKITFGQGFLLGLIISLIASTLYVLTWAVEFHFFMPDFIDKYSAMQVKQLQADGVSGQALEEAVKGIESANYDYKNNPFIFALYTYMEILPVGILIALFSALILKRKAPAASAQ